MKRHEKSHWESMLSGLVIGGGFGLFWALDPSRWWAFFPMLFAGALPFLHGLQGLLASRAQRRGERLSPADEEKLVLRLARDARGVLTPGLVALQSDLTAEQAEGVLARMTRKGYAALRVTDDGRLEYEFPEFMRRLDS